MKFCCSLIFCNLRLLKGVEAFRALSESWCRIFFVNRVKASTSNRPTKGPHADVVRVRPSQNAHSTKTRIFQPSTFSSLITSFKIKLYKINCGRSFIQVMTFLFMRPNRFAMALPCCWVFFRLIVSLRRSRAFNLSVFIWLYTMWLSFTSFTEMTPLFWATVSVNFWRILLRINAV